MVLLEGVEVAVNQDDGIGIEDRFHRDGIRGGDADRDEALPGPSRIGRAGAESLEQAWGQVMPALGGGSADVRLEQG